MDPEAGDTWSLRACPALVPEAGGPRGLSSPTVLTTPGQHPGYGAVLRVTDLDLVRGRQERPLCLGILEKDTGCPEIH